MTIHVALKTKLGREPSHNELKAECLRIIREVNVELAGEGQLAWQRKRR
jgi:hypothetical protein